MKFFKRSNEEEAEAEEEPEQVVEIKYVGGHKAYPLGKDTAALIYPDRIVIAWLDLIIPYSSITNVRSIEDKRITKTRVYYTGPAGLFWKKNYTYTVIDYNDGFDDQSIVIDFRSAAVVQKLIYERMGNARNKRDGTLDSGKDFDRSDIQTQRATLKVDSNKDDPLHILKIRLVKGEITTAEYVPITLSPIRRNGFCYDIAIRKNHYIGIRNNRIMSKSLS